MRFVTVAQVFGRSLGILDFLLLVPTLVHLSFPSQDEPTLCQELFAAPPCGTTECKSVSVSLFGYSVAGIHLPDQTFLGQFFSCSNGSRF